MWRGPKNCKKDYLNENVQAIDEVRTVEGISSDADAKSLTESDLLFIQHKRLDQDIQEYKNA